MNFTRGRKSDKEAGREEDDYDLLDVAWAYSDFRRYRDRIAIQIGFPEYIGILSLKDPRYEKLKDDPIRPFLQHSDCDGELTPDECAALAPRLRDIVRYWPENDRDRIKSLNLADILTDIADKKEYLKFT